MQFTASLYAATAPSFFATTSSVAAINFATFALNRTLFLIFGALTGVIGALAGYPLIKHCMNQGYDVVEFINGNTALKPADEPLLEGKSDRRIDDEQPDKERQQPERGQVQVKTVGEAFEIAFGIRRDHGAVAIGPRILQYGGAVARQAITAKTFGGKRRWLPEQDSNLRPSD